MSMFNILGLSKLPSYTKWSPVRYEVRVGRVLIHVRFIGGKQQPPKMLSADLVILTIN